MSRFLLPLAWLCLVLPGARVDAAVTTPLSEYFRLETERIATNAFAGIETRADWVTRQPVLREQLLDMLGLWPMPERTDLKATVTGTLERENVVVERIHFESLPGLYVTANLYRPKQVTGKLPAVLYACGHALVKTNGLSCGNKTAYQHHGIWFARNGYVALLIDTLQLGEIEGVHHGTHRLGQWWWNSRGYSPAGVEAWNGVRALDYLESRPEVDASRMGMTGRSGGGSYTWTTAAIDDRVRVAAPVAGITDLRNQVVDGVIEGHCDCMFFVNRHRWDFGLNAALLAPRPLLIVNTDRDTIFPLDGVQRVHAQVRRIYDLVGAADRLGLVIGPGPHQDTQDLQVPVFRWFGRHLKGEETVVREPAEKWFDPRALRVFSELPADERNTRAAGWFPRGESGAPVAVGAANAADSVLTLLRARVFAGWPDDDATPPRVVGQWTGGTDLVRLRGWRIESQPGLTLSLEAIAAGGGPAKRVVLRVLDGAARAEWDRLGDGGKAARLASAGSEAGVTNGLVVATFSPRDAGPGGTPAELRQQIQQRRRFMLLGQTLDGMRVWDIRQAVRVLRKVYGERVVFEIRGGEGMEVSSLLAGLFERGVREVRVPGLPASLRDGPDYLGLLQFGDVPWLRDLARARGLDLRVGP